MSEAIEDLRRDLKPFDMSHPMSQTRERPSLRMRWLALRVRFSVPSLLARADERKVVSWIAGINGALAIVTISLCAWLCDLPLVFPALGPTAFILFSSPFSRAAAPRSVIMGHLTGMLSGCGGWHLMTQISGSAVSLQNGGWAVLCSASLALAVSCLLLVRQSHPHPPACASALVIALGGATEWSALLAMAGAVVLLTGQAVCINRVAGVRVPAWSPRP